MALMTRELWHRPNTPGQNLSNPAKLPTSPLMGRSLPETKKSGQFHGRRTEEAVDMPPEARDPLAGAFFPVVLEQSSHCA